MAGQIYDGESERAIKAVLSRFHEAKEIGEVHQARHVRFRELHLPRRFEFVSHCRAVIKNGWQKRQPLLAKLWFRLKARNRRELFLLFLLWVALFANLALFLRFDAALVFAFFASGFGLFAAR